MKRLFAVMSLIVFFGIIAAPVFATDNTVPVIVSDEKPKVKKAETKKDCYVPCCEKRKAECDKAKRAAECDIDKK